MLNNSLRNWIYPNLKMSLDENEWQYIDEMLDNAYFIEEDGMELITIPPSPISDGKYGLQFSALNGAFITICFWEDVKQNGEKL